MTDEPFLAFKKRCAFRLHERGLGLCRSVFDNLVPRVLSSIQPWERGCADDPNQIRFQREK